MSDTLPNEVREAMARAIDVPAFQWLDLNPKPEHGWSASQEVIYWTDRVERAERKVDAALSALEAAGFEVNRKGTREALEPFARCADELDATEDTPRAPDGEWAKFRLLTDDYRRARAALAGSPQPNTSKE